ncbi:MAG: hypothetical protein IC227_06125 [Enterococcus lacertideformus]|uniref:Uncharacterized protein n=1 Tax=Enterococcus lacertideformus TaxID=2771493 RepID=A0A931F8M5_9ENTE|nr:hypothetical protein [Enterococcus lacertideformus]
MDDFERKFLMLALALGLGNACDFKVVGEEGKKNYQLLFSTLIKMIENDQHEFFIDKAKKTEIISSLKRTIDFYNTNSPKELQQLIESMNKNTSSNFMIIPTYINLEKYDHVYSLILYQKEDHCVVTMVDKLGIGSGEYSNGAFSKIKAENLYALSEFLFLTKFEYHKNSNYNLSEIIYQLGEGKYDREYLNLTMNGYKGVQNRPVVEILASLKTALYNYQVNIFDHTTNLDLMGTALETEDVYLKPKIGGAEEFYRHLFNAFKEETQRYNQAFEHAFNYYLQRKLEKKEISKDPNFSEKKFTIAYAKNFAEDPNTPESFKMSQMDNQRTFRVFSSEEEPNLKETLDVLSFDWKFSQQNKDKEKQRLAELVQEANKETKSTVMKKSEMFSIQR